VAPLKPGTSDFYRSKRRFVSSCTSAIWISLSLWPRGASLILMMRTKNIPLLQHHFRNLHYRFAFWLYPCCLLSRQIRSPGFNVLRKCVYCGRRTHHSERNQQTHVPWGSIPDWFRCYLRRCLREVLPRRNGAGQIPRSVYGLPELFLLCRTDDSDWYDGGYWTMDQ
jgi:hypothetical protein